MESVPLVTSKRCRSCQGIPPLQNSCPTPDVIPCIDQEIIRLGHLDERRIAHIVSAQDTLQ